MHHANSYKDLIKSFYRDVIGKRDVDLARKMISENYIQHNPMLKTGVEGVLEAIAFLKTLPAPDLSKPSPIQRIFQDGDYVFCHLWVEMGPVKQQVMDIFRLENGLLVAHWDGIQTVTGESEDWVGGASEVLAADDSKTNKAFVQEFFQAVMIEHALDQVDQYVDPAFVLHQLDSSNGMEGLERHISEIARSDIHLVLGEGEFVLVQSLGEKETVPYACYDLYRLQKGKVKDLWSISQAIPDQMPHSNGML